MDIFALSRNETAVRRPDAKKSLIIIDVVFFVVDVKRIEMGVQRLVGLHCTAFTETSPSLWYSLH
jgi:hypothetical protein